MKTYSVKEVAGMLNTNPETVRRWIRDKKLDAIIESKKGGHIIQESALQEFLRVTPKYAAVAKGTVAGAAVISSVMIGGLIAQKLIDFDQIKNARVSNKDMTIFLQGEIQKCLEAIQTKENTINQLQKQIAEEKRQIDEYQKLIDSLNK